MADRRGRAADGERFRGKQNAVRPGEQRHKNAATRWRAGGNDPGIRRFVAQLQGTKVSPRSFKRLDPEPLWKKISIASQKNCRQQRWGL